MENIESTEQVQPTWWDAKHTSAWDRVKEAMRRDWEQTKADFSSKHGEELDQDVPDTLKQAVGAEAIPPPGVPNPKADWAKTEPAVRYGFGAREKYGNDFKTWEPGLETKLKSEWSDMSDEEFDAAREDIRYGWDWHDKEATRH
jgi:hypothetical protein